MAAQTQPQANAAPPKPDHLRAPRLARFVRWGVLLAIWGFMTYTTIAHQRLGGGPEGAPPVDALCPFGGIATLYKLAAGGGYLQRTFSSSVILLVGVVVTALVLRRAFCGWVCPLGAMQELMGAIGRRLKLRRSLLHNAVDSSARPLKYLVLVLIVALTWATGTLVFRPYDPWAAYAHLAAGWSSLRAEFLVGTILLAVTVLGSLVLERSWCRYLCPLGGLLGMVSKAGATCVTRDQSTCIQCGCCDRACPVDLSVKDQPRVSSAECLNCGDCVAVCPVPNTLAMKMGRRPVGALSVGLLAVAIFFGTVGASKMMGLWESRPKSLEQIVAAGGQADPANIRGFMTFNEVARLFSLPAPQIVAATGLPADTPLDKPIKDIMRPLGREAEEVRAAVAALQGGSGAPADAPSSGAPAAPGASATPSADDISGMSTLADVERQYQVPASKLLEALGLPADTPHDKPLRDIMRPLGRHVTEVREAVARLRPAE